jgi:transposase-like protein
MFERRRKQSAHTAYRALLWALVLIVATMLYLDNSPIVLETDVEASDGITITREAESDVLIVLDYDAIRNSPASFEARDFSVAWINLFEQELGPVSIATPQSLSMKVLDASRVVILTSSVADQVPPSLLEKLRQHTLDGNTVVVERPKGKLRDTFSANGRAGERGGQALTFARGLADPYNDQLLEMPLSTQFVGSTAPRSGATTHLSIDGAPAIYAAPMGEGIAITVDFDFGEQMVALQQGRPSSNFGVNAADKTSVPKTSALIMAPELHRNTVPYADLLERFMIHGVIGAYAPLPAFWAFPGGASGALVAVHEDTELGDGGGWMLDYETERGGVSTLLSTVDSGLTASGAAILHRKGGEIGLAWKKPGTPHELDERVGLGEFEPIARPVGLEAQLDRLRKTLPINYVKSVRITDSWWDREWARPFELMAAQDLRIDTSYSPAPGAGYAFGTGFPFLVVNREGQPLGIRELPVVYPTGVTDGPELAELIEQSAQGHHQAITWAVEPKIFADFPDMERFEKWLAVFEIARQHDHIVTSTLRLDQFMRSRRAGRIQSRVVHDAHMPSGTKLPTEKRSPEERAEDEELAASTRKTATLLRVTVNAKRRGLSIIVPSRLQGQDFQLAKMGVNRVAGELLSGDVETVGASLVGYKFRRIPLDAGFNTIDVYYR